MVPGAPADQNSYRGKLGKQLGIRSYIHHLEDMMGIINLVMNCCNNFTALRRSHIHPESVTPRCNKLT